MGGMRSGREESGRRFTEGSGRREGEGTRKESGGD